MWSRNSVIKRSYVFIYWNFYNSKKVLKEIDVPINILYKTKYNKYYRWLGQTKLTRVC